MSKQKLKEKELGSFVNDGHRPCPAAHEFTCLACLCTHCSEGA